MNSSEAESRRLGADTKIGSYRITRVIGEGAMGVVYEGFHESLGKRVAIKTLLSVRANKEELVERFVREGKAIAKIRHPNVVDVFDVAVHEGLPYLVMEYLEGQDLGARMEHEAPMTPEAIADMLVPVVSALSAAHDAGIVHRDLKPENIFVTRTKGGTPEPKLVDFGISKLADTDAMALTSTHAMLGTPYYMSPEQAGNARKVDHRSDIFSFGVILYQCATHELPFKGDSLYELLGAIMTIEPPSPRSLVGKLPPAFEALIARAMRKDPGERFQSATELGSALLPFASTRTRLSFEAEFSMPVSVPASAPVAARPVGSRWLWASPLLLVGAVVGLVVVLRGRASGDEVRPPATPSAVVSLPITLPPAVAEAPKEPAPAPLPDEPEAAAQKAARPVHKVVAPRRTPADKPAPPPAPVAKAAPEPAPVVASPVPTPPASDLFLDRK